MTSTAVEPVTSETSTRQPSRQPTGQSAVVTRSTPVPRASSLGRSDSSTETTTMIDLVVPVYNEEDDLEPSVRRLYAFLQSEFPFSTVVTIADNASTDSTWTIASRLAAELPGVRALHLSEKGRGRALKQAWSASDAAVVAYTDVDLSTDLRALLPLVAPLISRHSDVAIGTRLSGASRTSRGPKREFVSRSYNLLLHGTLAASFSDAQ